MTRQQTDHETTIVRTGHPDHGTVRAECTCGWKGPAQSRRTTEGARLAARDATDHDKHMEQGPNQFCTNSCPHLTVTQ